MESKEQRILSIAREHFMRYGYRKTCLDDIARDAKISKGCIYNYFKNKEALFLKFVEIEFTKILEQASALIPENTTPEEQLIQYALQVIQVIRCFFSSHGTTLGIIKELRETHESTGTKRHQEIAILEKILKKGVQQGIFKDQNLHATASLISQLLSQFDLRWLEMEANEAESEVRAIFQLIFEGLRA